MAEMNFKRGDGLTHYFQMPVDGWVAGGKLFFAAKPAIDDDVTDAAAVIDKEFTDSDVIDSNHELDDPNYTTYQLSFAPDDIVAITFGSEKRKKYLGEFQFVPPSGVPETFPGNDDFIDVIIYADIKRGTT